MTRTQRALVRRGHVLADRFCIAAPVAAGGMGHVYRARDLACDRDVAIKVLYLDGADHLQRFDREARVLAALAHPRIVTYVGHGRTADDLYYLAEEWVDGPTLAERIEAAGLAVGDALWIAEQVASALAAAHACEFVHRDVKPSNILCIAGEPGGIKLVDFGIARPIAGGIRVTETGGVLGTPRYMAPEQANGSRFVDGRADVFALGCVLVECLADVATAPAVPADLPALVDRMRAADPIDRPTAEQVAGELARLRSLLAVDTFHRA